MKENRTRYPSYDLLKYQDEWDPHTREIVKKRLGPFSQPKTLTNDEVILIKSITSHLIYDNRSELLDYVTHHIDQKLTSKIGESQRKPTIPPEKQLIREGLKALNNLAKHSYHKSFIDLATSQQFSILSALQRGQVKLLPGWDKEMQQELFKKLASEITSAYYSHPIVWSEIGYGGPAYPRGYVRVEQGLTDPWEARQDEK
ncbi:gluconate 2-dehydrogenase subunit 3 family protein [Desulfotomaculum defluvii]